MKIDFEKPPINEVSIGMQFPPLSSLRSEHVGLFWSRIREEFPNVTQVPPVGSVAQIPPELFPIPRFWFISKDDATLIQIQKGGFWFNWRLRDEQYPRFESVFKAFQYYREHFTFFLKEDLRLPRLEQVRYQMTYTNIFEQVPYWTGPEDTQKIVPSFAFVESGLKDAKVRDFNSTAVFQIRQDLALSISIRNGTNQITERRVLVIELDASGSFPYLETKEADDWYRQAHAAIIDSFTSFTSQNIQNQYWFPK